MYNLFRITTYACTESGSLPLIIKETREDTHGLDLLAHSLPGGLFLPGRTERRGESPGQKEEGNSNASRGFANHSTKLIQLMTPVSSYCD